MLRGYALDARVGDLFDANAYVDICPPSLQDKSASDPAERIPLRPVAPIGSGDVVRVAAARARPLVYLTLGTYVSGQVDSLRAAAAGLGMLDVDALVTVGPDGDPAALGPLPDSVRVERFVSQGVLLPHLDAVAHHGGSGTMLGALSQGLPQLLLPHGADQFMNTQALLDTGAGPAPATRGNQPAGGGRGSSSTDRRPRIPRVRERPRRRDRGHARADGDGAEARTASDEMRLADSETLSPPRASVVSRSPSRRT
ncbi:MAG: glycosyltransferase [Thermoleophilaceae bacterium]